ncbi:MAG: IS110 family transposase [Micrococcales bacterium]|nr:IS110 family transposase [Micrococcales bacterium]
MPVVEEEVLHTRCAGIDISKTDAKVCVRIVPEGRKRARVDVKVWGSTVPQIRQLRDYLIDQAVTCVVMEATSSYWKPFYYVLEDAGFELILVNPQHVKTMRGRKTDVADANHLARLGALGLLRPSFVPPKPIRALRLWTRRRLKITQSRTREISRLEKLLEDAGIKITSESSRTLNASVRKILDAICAGEADPGALADLSRLKTTRKRLIDALTGTVETWHVELIRSHLRIIDQHTDELARIDEHINDHLAPYQTQVDLLMSVPGLGPTLAVDLLAEIGADMTIFPTADHLASWCGVAPGSNQSAAVVKSTKCKKGDHYAKRALTMAANQAVRHPGTFYQARYQRLARRMGNNKAQTAIARSLAVAIWNILTKGEPHHDLGAPHFHTRDTDRMIAWHQARIKDLTSQHDDQPAATPSDAPAA